MSPRTPNRLIVALVPLVAFACAPPESARSPAAPETTPEARDDAELGPKLPGIQSEELAPGTGEPAKNGDRVIVHYTGTLVDGTKFDSSVDRGTPFEFVIGEHQVIAGWELGVVGMQKGSKRRLTIPPHLGYGSRGSPPKIGPDATLVFVIEVLDIAPAPAKPAKPPAVP